MMAPRNTLSRGIKYGKGDYGYHLWLQAHNYGSIAGLRSMEGIYAKSAHVDHSLVYFEGLHGQHLYISPADNLVVLRMGEKPCSDWDSSWVINQLSSALRT